MTLPKYLYINKTNSQASRVSIFANTLTIDMGGIPYTEMKIHQAAINNQNNYDIPLIRFVGGVGYAADFKTPVAAVLSDIKETTAEWAYRTVDNNNPKFSNMNNRQHISFEFEESDGGLIPIDDLDSLVLLLELT